ncbi:hypothetical protein [Chitinophaga flava]|uniref:Uncharacterized protein n=1 Tax=Chitinophaga flava TaxID=2259036 RepID=A0A365XWR4_9BACT|nr:hypothetical protein [Chitinophaga flava]RBL90650.1 hypothetical protein DF182_29815 [Chitinophaga flava]
MKLVPFEDYTLISNLSPEEVKKRLEEKLNLKRRTAFISFRPQLDTDRPYEGAFRGNKFVIKRIINYRNSFLPEITGVVTHEVVHTAIKIKMRMSVFVCVFLVIWLLLMSMILFSVKSSTGADIIPLGIFGNIPFLSQALLCLLMYAVTLGAFKYESMKSKKFLAALFEGREEGK